MSEILSARTLSHFRMGSSNPNTRDSESENGPQFERISLKDYIDENSSLFLVMGVFAALSVYISQLPLDSVDEEIIQLGLVSSLLITGLLAGVALLSLPKQASDDAELFNYLFDIRNLDLILFLALFLTLIYSLSQIVTEETQSLALISLIVLLVLVFAVHITAIMVANRELRPYINHTELRTSATLFIILSIGYLFMERMNNYLESEYQFVSFDQADESVFLEILPTIVYLVFNLSMEMLQLLIITAVTLVVISLIDALKQKYRKLVDLLNDH